jgi:RecG-like helicase
MDWQGLNSRIEELHSLISSPFSPLSGRSIKHPYGLLNQVVYDWRPAWDKAREIQEAFKSGIRYPTVAERQNAWTRFNDVRNDLSRRSNADRDSVFTGSKAWRDLIMSEIESARYSKLGDVIFFFDPTTAEDMKRMGERLKEAGRRLSENKHQMLREHKDECFQRIQEVRATHDAFWGEYKKAREVRQHEHRQRISEVLARVDANISSNHEKKAKAEGALERVEENIAKLHDMLGNARGDEFRERVEGWLSEAVAKRESIQESVRRIGEWIDQDERRRNDIVSKQR